MRKNLSDFSNTFLIPLIRQTLIFYALFILKLTKKTSLRISPTTAFLSSLPSVGFRDTARTNVIGSVLINTRPVFAPHNSQKLFYSDMSIALMIMSYNLYTQMIWDI